MATTANASDSPTRDDEWDGLVEFLARPGSHADRPQRVERIDTHISSVFLTERFAYKLKKRVAFEFLDFRTLAARQAACREEVRVNRRLAPDIYLGVEGLARDAAGRVRWAGPRDEACEWVVKMRRLPVAARLDRLLAQRQLTETELREFIDTLLAFYQRLPPLPVSAPAYLSQLAHHVDGNDAELSGACYPVSAASVRRVHDAQRRMLRLWPERWACRVCDGRIIEGHGDLRPEHVYLLPRPVVIDAIEFNAEFRRLDVLDELCFLAVESEMLGAGEFGRRVLARYGAESGDRPAPGVGEFYRSYRACVRAKVAWLRSRQTQGEEQRTAQETAGSYVAVAETALGGFARPWLVVVRGRSGTGKSAIAGALAEPLVATLLRTDEVRREVQPTAGDATSSPTSWTFGQGRYSAERREAVYGELLQRATQLLGVGRSAILDGTFLDASSRRAAATLAESLGANFLETTCRCSDELAQRRVLERLERGGDPSEIQPEWLAAQARQETPCTPAWPTCLIDTERPQETTVAQALDAARRELDRAGATRPSS